MAVLSGISTGWSVTNTITNLRPAKIVKFQLKNTDDIPVIRISNLEGQIGGKYKLLLHREWYRRQNISVGVGHLDLPIAGPRRHHGFR